MTVDRLLDPAMPEEEVDAELRALGIDPERLAARGVAFVEAVKAELCAAFRRSAHARLKAPGAGAG